jgi:uncharacterized membrane protein
MSVLAAIRPSDWEFPLFVHVLGASVLVGGLVTAMSFQVLAWRGRDRADVTAFGRAGFWALLAVALPGWIVMRLGGEWIYSEEGWTGEDDPAWLGIGFITADVGIPLLLVAIILAGLGARRMKRGAAHSVLGRIATPLTMLLLVAYLVTVWAMTAKPN